MNMTKTAVKAALGFSTDVELARFFGTTKQAIGHWPDDEPIPSGRQWQLRAMRPDLFQAAKQQKAA